MPELSLEEELSLVPLERVARSEPDPRCGHSGRQRCESAPVFGSVQRVARATEFDRVSPRGPGWFDSSWDLRRGCEVKEGWPGDSGLRDWIEGWLYAAGAAGVAGGVGASLSAT